MLNPWTLEYIMAWAPVTNLSFFRDFQNLSKSIHRILSSYRISLVISYMIVGCDQDPKAATRSKVNISIGCLAAETEGGPAKSGNSPAFIYIIKGSKYYVKRLSNHPDDVGGTCRCP